MTERPLDCFIEVSPAALPIHTARPGDPHPAYATASGFTGAAGEIVLLPGETGLAGALLGLGARTDPHIFGVLPARLPEGAWHLAPGVDRDAAVLGWAMGAYRYDLHKQCRGKAMAKLVLPQDVEPALRAARATWLARDLINTHRQPAGPGGTCRSGKPRLEKTSDTRKRDNG